jgi:hypothetical protein
MPYSASSCYFSFSPLNIITVNTEEYPSPRIHVPKSNKYSLALA